jgi:peptide deformylase
MKIYLIKQSSVTEKELSDYKNGISKLKGSTFTAPMVGMEKRIITIRLGGDYEELTLVNPTIIETSENPIVYFEKDSTKNKIRKTLRFSWIKVNTDNLGVIEFQSNTTKWNTREDLLSDTGLFECIMVQRLIDSIDGIDITHPSRIYNTQIFSDKQPRRNERVMIQSPEGKTEFVKYKNTRPMLEAGYKLL